MKYDTVQQNATQYNSKSDYKLRCRLNSVLATLAGVTLYSKGVWDTKNNSILPRNLTQNQNSGICLFFSSQYNVARHSVKLKSKVSIICIAHYYELFMRKALRYGTC